LQGTSPAGAFTSRVAFASVCAGQIFDTISGFRVSRWLRRESNTHFCFGIPPQRRPIFYYRTVAVFPAASCKQHNTVQFICQAVRRLFLLFSVCQKRWCQLHRQSAANSFPFGLQFL